MIEPVTQSQITEVLDTVRAMQPQRAELALAVKVEQAEIRKTFNLVEAKLL